MKKLFKVILYFLLIALGIILVATLVFNAYYSVLNKRAGKELEEVPQLALDGELFRDLNKNGKLDPYEDHRQPVSIRVEDLLSRMTLEEKVGLMWHPPIGVGDQGALQPKPGIVSSVSTYNAVIQKKLNHFNLLGAPGAEALATWSNKLQRLAEQTRLGIPISISTVPRHGLSNSNGMDLQNEDWSRWPEPLGLAAIGDSLLVADFGRIARQEYRAVGIQVALHPQADLATGPHRAPFSKTFGEDARLAAKLTAAYIYGFQGSKLGKNSVACMTKHWPGSDPKETNIQFEEKNQLAPSRKFAYHLLPFEAALKASTAMMMPYYGTAIDQKSEHLDMNFDKKVITQLLRQEYSYEGVVCSEWGIIEGISFLGYELVEAKNRGIEDLSIEERIAKVIAAGVDQFGGNMHTRQLIRLVEKGVVSEDRIDQSARRLLRVKFELGLFDQPFVDPEKATEIVNQKSFREQGKMAQRRSIVLLKNQGNTDTSKILPLKKGIKIYTENIDRAVASNYAAVVNRLEEADLAILRMKMPAEPRTSNFTELVAPVDLNIQEPERSRLLKVMQKKPTIVCLYLDRPAVIPEITDQCSGLLADFGAEDDAVLDVIFGDFKPEAKLPFELPSSMEAAETQKEEVPYDSKGPLFPFGFGLTYED